MKKLAAIIVTVIIAFVWVITVIGIGPVGPIQDKIKLGLDISGGVYVVLEAQTTAVGSDLKALMDQTQAIIEERVNGMGLSEPVITVEGDKRIRVELPGVADSEEAIQAIGATAKLQFKLADGTVVLEGNDISGSTVKSDPDHGGYLITLEFSSAGAQKFLDATTKAYNREVQPPFMDGVTAANQIAIVLDNDVLSAPAVDNGPISGGSAVITRPGGFSQSEAINTSTLIRGGALPADLKEVESSAIGATIGMGALQHSIIGGLIGILCVFVVMILGYRFMGLGASLALLLYVPLLLWILVGIGGVMTLPGIAGLILSIGMAVDANVIMFARIKDEVAEGKTIRAGIDAGFRKAIGTILDGHVTTLIVAFVLYQFGTGPVRGFAMILIIGILLSLFTALVISNQYMHAFAESKFIVNRGWLGVHEGDPHQGNRLSKFYDFIKPRRFFYIATISIIVIGLGIGIFRGFNLGIDFTGGTMMQIELGKEVPTADIRNTFAENGIDNIDVVTFGADNSGVIIKTTQPITSVQREQIMTDIKNTYGVDDSALQTFEQFGPSVGKMLTNNAILALLISMGLMFIYTLIRFKFRLGLVIVLCVLHDAVIMVALYGLLHMTLNNPFIAAILTVVGYSTNDTIIIFVRIRENLNGMKRQPLDLIVDQSVNQTLVRSIMTSTATIVAIIPLIFIGGDTVRQFAVPLALGIIAGTLSSIFIASPFFYDIAKKGHRFGSGKYKGAERKLTDEDRKQLTAEGRKQLTAKDEPAADDEEETEEDEKLPVRNYGGVKGKKKRSKSQRKPGGNGAVV